MIKKQYLTYCVVAPKWHRHYTRTDLIKRDDHFTTVLEKNEFSESQFFQPWYKQSHPVPCLEKANVLWDIPQAKRSEAFLNQKHNKHASQE